MKRNYAVSQVGMFAVLAVLAVGGLFVAKNALVGADVLQPKTFAGTATIKVEIKGVAAGSAAETLADVTLVDASGQTISGGTLTSASPSLSVSVTAEQPYTVKLSNVASDYYLDTQSLVNVAAYSSAYPGSATFFARPKSTCDTGCGKVEVKLSSSNTPIPASYGRSVVLRPEGDNVTTFYGRAYLTGSTASVVFDHLPLSAKYNVSIDPDYVAGFELNKDIPGNTFVRNNVAATADGTSVAFILYTRTDGDLRVYAFLSNNEYFDPGTKGTKIAEFKVTQNGQLISSGDVKVDSGSYAQSDVMPHLKTASDYVVTLLNINPAFEIDPTTTYYSSNPREGVTVAAQQVNYAHFQLRRKGITGNNSVKITAKVDGAFTGKIADVTFMKFYGGTNTVIGTGTLTSAQPSMTLEKLEPFDNYAISLTNIDKKLTAETPNHNSIVVKQGQLTEVTEMFRVLPPVVEPPLAPTDLKAKITAKRLVMLSWKDNATDETGFMILRAEVKGKHEGAFTSLGNLSANVNSFIDSTAKKGKKYHYKIQAFKQGSSQQLLSAPTNTVTVKINK